MADPKRVAERGEVVEVFGAHVSRAPRPLGPPRSRTFDTHEAFRALEGECDRILRWVFLCGVAGWAVWTWLL